MAGKSPVTASDEQRLALKVMAEGADRSEADRARAVLLTLGGWTSARIAEAFGVREDTVRLWRSEFMIGGIDALRASAFLRKGRRGRLKPEEASVLLNEHQAPDCASDRRGINISLLPSSPNKIARHSSHRHKVGRVARDHAGFRDYKRVSSTVFLEI